MVLGFKTVFNPSQVDLYQKNHQLSEDDLIFLQSILEYPCIPLKIKERKNKKAVKKYADDKEEFWFPDYDDQIQLKKGLYA